MTDDEQMRMWVDGNSVHRHFEGGGQCVPDFSCCRPELQQPDNVRRAFAAAGEMERTGFLMNFLGAMIARCSDKRVHIAGGGEPQ